MFSRGFTSFASVTQFSAYHCNDCCHIQCKAIVCDNAECLWSFIVWSGWRQDQEACMCSFWVLLVRMPAVTRMPILPSTVLTEDDGDVDGTFVQAPPRTIDAFHQPLPGPVPGGAAGMRQGAPSGLRTARTGWSPGVSAPPHTDKSTPRTGRVDGDCGGQPSGGRGLTAARAGAADDGTWRRYRRRGTRRASRGRQTRRRSRAIGHLMRTRMWMRVSHACGYNLECAWTDDEME